MSQSQYAKRSLAGLSGAEWVEIRKRCFFFAYSVTNRHPLSGALPEPEDIVHTAIEKVISGERTWKPDKVSLIHMLFGAIRSIISSESKKASLRPQVNAEDYENVINIDAVRFSYDDFNFVSRAFEYLKGKDEELAEFFLKAGMIAGEGAHSDREIAEKLGLSASSFSKRKTRIAAIIGEWKDADLNATKSAG